MMARLHSTLITLVLVALGSMLSAPAHSDDWLQYRKDPWRRAASTDEVRLPLAEIWRWDLAPGPLPGVPTHGNLFQGGPFHAVIWKERVFFVTRGRLLTCADVRTGRVFWQQTLLEAAGPRCDAGLAVSEGGLVFIYEGVRPKSGPEVHAAKPFPPAWVRVLNAADGKPVATYAMARRWLRGEARPRGLPGEFDWPGPDGYVRLALSAGVPAQTAFLDNRHHDDHFVGHASPPLLMGNSLWAASGNDLLFRWAVGHDPSFLTFARAPAGPVNEFNLIEAQFDSVSPAATPTGAVLAARGQVRFLVAVGPGTQALWFRDVPWILGAPAVQDDLIFTGVGGIYADRGLMATDAATGGIRWMYPTPRIPPDPPDPPLAYIRRQWGREPSQFKMSRERTGGTLTSASAAMARAPVVVGKRVYASVAGAIVALDQGTGQQVWRQPLPPRSPVMSMAASRDHLFVSFGLSGQAGLVALQLEDGREVWSQRVPHPGGLSLAHGLVFYADGASLIVYGPAERTYRLAVDSPRKEDYEEPPRKPEEAEGGEGDAKDGAAEPARTPEPVIPAAEPAAPAKQAADGKEPAAPGAEVPVLKAPPAADATILRLRWSDPLDDLIQKVRERRAVAKGLPLTLVLDWLNADRSALAGPAGWSLAQTEAFAQACRTLAAEGRPDYFEVGSEVNAYLIRYPDQIESVRSLLKAARQAVAEVSPQTQVMVSLNLELWRGLYSRGVHLPFGKLPARQPATLAQIQSLLADGTAVAFTSWPEAAFARGAEVPRSHFAAARAAFPRQQLLWTRLSVRHNRVIPAEQALYLQRLLQGCYWLNVSLIAYPELRAEGQPGPDRDYALRDEGGTARLSHLAWQGARALKWVKRLSLEGPSQVLDAEPRAEPAGELTAPPMPQR